MLIFVIAVMVVLIISFFCSIFESVLLSISRPQVEVMVNEGRRSGRMLANFKDNIDSPIAAILILNTTAHTIGAAVAGASYANVFAANTLWIFSILFTLAVLLFTEIVPKTLGVSYARQFAPAVAYGIDLLTRALKPLVVVSEAISRSLRKEKRIPVTSVEEIRLLATLGRSEGIVGNRTADIIVRATRLRELNASNALLPRKDVKFLYASMDRGTVLKLIRDSGHSRFPFLPRHDSDEVAGIAFAKELLDWMILHPGEEIDWTQMLREPLIVPQSMTLISLLRTFQDERRHLAIVVNEYGSIEGIVTLEDVLEEVVGEIFDESDFNLLQDLHKAPDGRLMVHGHVDLRRLADRLGVTWQEPGDATTVGGLVTEKLERIPVAGDCIDWQGYRIEVTNAGVRRVKLVAISKR